MPTLPELRAAFAENDADHLARQVGVTVGQQPPRHRWTARAVWYIEDDCVTAVVGEHEARDTDEVLGFGLLRAGELPLRLVLPEAFAGPSLTRAAWFDHPVTVHTYDGGVVSPPRGVSRERSIARAGGPETKPPLYLQNLNPDLRALVDWATTHPALEPSHRPDVRAWSHKGQRVLEIRGRSNHRVKAGIDARGQAPIFTRNDLAVSGITAVQERVEGGIDDAREQTFQVAEEHHLQARLRDHPKAVGLEHPVLREVAAWRPKGRFGGRGRGFIDLLGLDGHGDIVVVETKLGGGHMLVLQGLDYWIWANHNIEWLRTRLNASPDAEIKLCYVVAGKTGAMSRISDYAARQLELLNPQVDRSVRLLSQWETDPITSI